MRFPQLQCDAIKLQHSAVPRVVDLAPLQFGVVEGARILRVGDGLEQSRVGKGAEVTELATAPFRYFQSEFGVVVGEELERRGSIPFLAHEDEDRVRNEAEKSGSCAVGSRVDLLAKALAKSVV